jgi:lactate 2-monooxygenase
MELVHERLVRGTPSAAPKPRPTPAALRTLAAISRSHPGPFLANLRSPVPRAAVETFLEVFARPSLTWDDLGWLRARTKLPIVLKGIVDPRDAGLALDRGVDGIIVSNHGGRQVDGGIGALTVLPEIVDLVAGRVPVLFDSGIRGGADAFKALALGARAVCIGRPWVWGLAIAGSDGVSDVMRYLMAELDITMALTGCPSLAHVDADLLRAQ